MEAMIPRRMAFFWAGRTMPWLRFVAIRSFRLLNPEWDVIVYHWDSPVELSPAEHDYLGHLPDVDVEVAPWRPATNAAHLGPAQMSDLCGWEYLADGLGWFADNDIVFTQSMTGLLDSVGKANVVLSADEWLSIGLLAAGEEGGCYYRVIRDDAARMLEKLGDCYQAIGIELLWASMGNWAKHIRNEKAGNYLAASIGKMGHEAMSLYCEAIQLRHPSLKPYNLPNAVIYPVDWRRVDELWGSEFYWQKADTIGLHWFGGHELSLAGERRLSPDNVQQERSTVGAAVREHLCSFPW